jgi:hypothetical protein
MRAGEPSTDPSSITTISSAGRVWSTAEASAPSMYAAWLWLGTTTLTRASRATSGERDADNDAW